MKIQAKLEVGKRYQIVFANLRTRTKTLKHISEDGVLVFSGGLILDENSNVKVRELLKVDYSKLCY